jgi:predicted dehydrogenase
MKIGFLGTGMMGLSHIELIRDEFPQVELAAICDPHGPYLEKARAAAPAARLCRDANEMCSSDVDAIVISTPGHTHADLTEMCLKAGKHVFAEKPVMTTRAGCRRMVDLASRFENQIVLINHELRYSKFFEKIKDLVAGGEIGEPQLVWCKEFRGPFLKKVNDWIQDSRYSGGCLVDKNCHHFDLMNWWVGSRPKRVCGFGGNDVVHVVKNQYEVIDHASVSFEYENGVRGGLLLCMFSPKTGEDLEMGMIGSEGRLETKMSREEIWHWKRGADSADPIVHHMPSRKVGWHKHHGFVETHAAFFRAIKEGGRPLTDVRDCVGGTLLAIAAEDAIKSGTVVSVMENQ